MNDNQRQPSETVPLGATRPRAQDDRTALVAYHRQGATAATLREGDAVVVGRGPPAHFIVDDSSISREHAQFSVTADGVEVVDLNSTNGTYVHGARIERARLKLGDAVTLGEVVMRVESAPAGTRRLKGLDSHDRFVSMLEDDVARSEHFSRPLGVLIVRAADRAAHMGAFAPHIIRELRKIDRAALYSASCVELAMPETSFEAVEAFAQRLATFSAAEGGPLLVGAAMFPEGGRTADKLVAMAHEALQDASLSQPVRFATSGAPSRDKSTAWVRGPGPMTEVMRMIERLAESTIPVLIHGETGVGKELAARALHGGGPRKDAPMITVNCGALTPGLIESTLFGHEKGAFTGATSRKAGVFEAASRGTVFLDEIGELPLDAQAALLRVLETGTLTRVGATTEIKIDARVVAASHRDLESMTEDGTFRLDLLYRLNAMTLVIPPLRERPGEVEPLALHFLQEAGTRAGPGAATKISDEALATLKHWHWPGNVRELKNAIERAAVIARGDVIENEDLPARVQEPRQGISTGAFRAPASLRAKATPDEGFKQAMRTYERQLLLDALTHSGGKQKDAAERLAMPLRTFVHKLKTLGIKRKQGAYEVSEDEEPQ